MCFIYGYKAHNAWETLCGEQWRSTHWVGLVRKLRGPISHGLSPRKLENVKNAGEESMGKCKTDNAK